MGVRKAVGRDLNKRMVSDLSEMAEFVDYVDQGLSEIPVEYRRSQRETASWSYSARYVRKVKYAGRRFWQSVFLPLLMVLLLSGASFATATPNMLYQCGVDGDNELEPGRFATSFYPYLTVRPEDPAEDPEYESAHGHGYALATSVEQPEPEPDPVSSEVDPLGRLPGGVSEEDATLMQFLNTDGPIDPPELGTVHKTAEGWSIGVHEAVSEEQRQEVHNLILENKSCFAYGMADLCPGYKGTAGPFMIAPPGQELTGPPKNVVRRARRRAPMENDVQDEHMHPLQAVGFVTECHDAVISHEAVIAAKKDPDTGEWTQTRCCYNYATGIGGINKYTPKDSYTLPLPDQLYADVEDRCEYLSILDLRAGFLQIPIPEQLQKYTAFYWRGKLFKYTRAPFGLANMPSHFQRCMDTAVMEANLQDSCKPFIDDLLIHTSTYEGHLAVLKRVFAMLEKNGLKAHPSKSLFMAREVTFLGTQISAKGMTPSEDKVRAIRALPIPTDLSSLRRLFGFASYYRGFVPHFSEISKPLTELMGKEIPWVWTEERDRAWQEMKDALCKEGNALRRPDRNRPYLLHTDWSAKGMSAVLGQLDDDGNEYLVACTSRSCSKEETRYGSYRGEMLAATWGIRSFRHYLLGTKHPFTLYTDHKGLTWLMSNREVEGQYARWQCSLSDYDFVITYKPGAIHEVADVPSRFPIASSVDRTGAREPISVSRYQAEPPAPQDPLEPTMPISAEARSEALVTVVEFDGQSAFGAHGSCLDQSPITAYGMHSLDSLVHSIVAHTEEDAGILFPPGEIDGPVHGNRVPDEGQPWEDPTTLAAEYEGLLCASLLSHVKRMEVEIAAAEGPSDFINNYLLDGFDDPVCHALFSSAAEEEIPLFPEQLALRRLAASQVEECRLRLDRVQVADQPVLGVEFDGSVTSIDAGVAPLACVSTAMQEGVTVLELFGGMAGGLEMLLRNSVSVKRYMYCDKSPQARAIAEFRLTDLSHRYPDLFPREAWEGAFTSVPQDVYLIGEDELLQAGCLDGAQWFLCGGFECADLSLAGSRSGLAGTKSSTFYPLRQILGLLQTLQSSRPPLYLIENVAMQYGTARGRAVVEAFAEISQSLGTPVVLDAARVGSYAHRLRDYWTNVCAPEMLQLALDSVERDPSLQLVDILQQGYAPQICRKVNHAPWYQANATGQPLRVLPTLVARESSYAFRFMTDRATGTQVPGPGIVIDPDGEFVSLSMSERELALGYEANCTACPGVSLLDRHSVTGGCFDANAVGHLLAFALAIRMRDDLGLVEGCLPAAHASAVELGGSGVDSLSPKHQALKDLLLDGDVFIRNVALSAAAGAQDEAYVPFNQASKKDIWSDPVALSVLQGEPSSFINDGERYRVSRRTRRYRWTNGKMFRKMEDGTLREVPPPQDRLAIVTNLHGSNGHFGRRRTTHLVMLTYWWSGLYRDVTKVVSFCSACSRTKVSFNATQPVLQSLPIRGLLYSWGLDLFGPYPMSENGFTYVLVCIEHFSKWIEVFPLKSKSSAEVAYHFLHGILARYSAPAEVVTDGGGEFEGQFSELLVKAMIDHRVTSASHPQANGATERAVKTVKTSLNRHVDQEGNAERWDMYIPWIVLGYRVTRQESTCLSPYEILYAVPPVIPPSIRERVEPSVSFDDPEVAAESILLRAQLIEQACVMAGHNLKIAQHRDTLRYAHLRSGGYLPGIVRFTVGQYVYVKDTTEVFHPTARPEILRVLEVRPSGVLLLVGSCGTTIAVNAIHCSPCHLEIRAPDPLVPQAGPSKGLSCAVCRLPDDEQAMLLCDSCDQGWHTYCLTPALTEVPRGDWICPQCVQAGVNITSNRTQRAEYAHKRDSRTPAKKTVGRMVRASTVRPQQLVEQAEIPPRPLVSDSATADRPLRGNQRGVTSVRLEQDVPRPPVSDNAATVAPRRSLRLSPKGVAHVSMVQLPDSEFELVSGPGVLAALQVLMPGPWTLDHATAVAAHCEKDRLFYRVAQWEVDALLRFLDFNLSASIIDMCSGRGDIVKGLSTAFDGALSVVGNEKLHLLPADYHLDPLQPSSFERIKSSHGMHVIVSAPAAWALDLFLPLASRYARHMVCCLVPASYVCEFPAARVAWLADMASQGRLHVIAHSLRDLADVSRGPSMVWVIVFSSREIKTLLLRSGATCAVSMTLTTASMI
jgi:hypothetical protein